MKSASTNIKAGNRTQEKQGESEKSKREGAAAKPPVLKASKRVPDTAEKVIVSKEATAAVLSDATAYNAVRVGVSAAKIAHATGAVTDIATGIAGLAGATGYATGAVGHGLKLHQTLADERYNGKRSEELARDAYAYRRAVRQGLVIDEKDRAKQAAAQLEYRRVTEPLIASRPKTRARTELDKQFFGSNLTRYTLNAAGASSSFAGAVGAATVLTGPVGAALGTGAGVAELVAAHAQEAKALADLDTAAKKRDGLAQWKNENKRKDPEVASLYRAYDRGISSREKLARRTLKTARVGYFKGGLGVAVGISATVLFGLAAGAGVLLTGGIGLLAFGALVGGGILGWVAVQSLRDARVARRAKRLQRQARSLLATHSIEELSRMMRETAAHKRKAKVATVERKSVFTRKKAGRVRTVDVLDNPYLCALVDAHKAAPALGNAKPTPEASAARARIEGVLKALGRSREDVQACFDKASAEKHTSDKAAVLAEEVARSLDMPWTADKGPLHAKRYMGRLEELREKQLANGGELDFDKLADEFFSHVNFTDFDIAMETYVKESTGQKQSELLALALIVWRKHAGKRIAAKLEPTQRTVTGPVTGANRRAGG